MKRTALLIALVLFIYATPVMAQDEMEEVSPSRAGYLSLGITGGLMVDPDMGAGMISADYYITEEISVGPYFQAGGGKHDSYWGMSGQVKVSAALATNTKAKPYGHIGIGFVQLDFEERDDDPEYTYLFPVGGGMEFEMTDMISLDFGGTFNITEDPFAGLMVGMRIVL